MWLVMDAIMQSRPIRLGNNGRLRRDYTYSDDAAEAVVRLLLRPPAADPAWQGDAPDPARSGAPWQIFNIGNSNPVEILDLVRLIEEATGRTAVLEFLPMQPGDVPETYADASALEDATGFRPRTSIAEGVARFATWFRQFRSPVTL
jgi:UDP-glucuronate 4-epimerase